MNVGIHLKKYSQNQIIFIDEVLTFLDQKNVKIFLTDFFYHNINEIKPNFQHKVNLLEKSNISSVEMMISMGGDGTLLSTVAMLKSLGTPILGINLGRLGFLANVSKDVALQVLARVIEGDYDVSKRSLLELTTTSNNLFEGFNFAINECTVSRRDISSMIIVHTYINDDFLNSYWADGLIISTPSGSTAYSLSCGGPIVWPSSQTIIIAPVSPHNLSARPIVVPSNKEIRFTVESRSDNFLVSLDSRIAIATTDITLTIKQASFYANLIKSPFQTFISTIREKLKWGADVRKLES